VKKSLKKLTLSRETLGHLDDPAVRDARGAYGTIETACCDTMRQCSVMSCERWCLPEE
jgi:hypothetical protein